ncbi:MULTISPECIES: PEP-CTERM sorting domain-containing protein [unclassified Tolypothrix]|uniref:PEP-CTERM sorting domain-containing protein n=1 Tax=unclassified Tolypothrix TaxID=2649714 RepID=UPI0005EAB30A|nr:MULTISPECIES: PEP-CTERM sorting domain-containing protein [unclassified Tolypothrix]BAY88296.1 hypothetical protein NIES3275_02710 [Microchaete diplosiphon NIES-3275]EKF02354.1 PEP-CTERM putative exosortase interaction domain protein [Tolypothrix sp. PCC 7601]MBE9082364.1 PEP-CTERM sorting domain-containing protein [Tolypothrix sp. LEGE 11397]UYD28990.1 PEP-CTERM sorting domain-containing protein [Tolypothrix sp. PCC 7712]UYD35096.1 PEP-CTERM sorting domain-containing protein [Tolypothrix s
MKLAKKLSIAATSVILSVAAVSAKPSEAASVKFASQAGGTFNYNVVTDTNNETLAKSSTITVSGLAGVTNVNVADSSFLKIFGFDENQVVLTLKKAATGTAIGNPFAGLDFSIISKFTTPATVSFSVLNGTQFNAGNTTGPIEDVPEPMTVGGTLVAIGFGTWLKRKKAESVQKA